MFFTKPWFESAVRYKRSRRLEPKKWFFQEILPLCSKNEITSRKLKLAGSACTEELNAFFSCLRKWEFDDLRCLKDHDAYINCLDKQKKHHEEIAAAFKNEDSTAISAGGKVPIARLNKLLKQWPQPDMGTSPYKTMKRLPNQSYAEDIFHRKKVPTKKA